MNNCEQNQICRHLQFGYVCQDCPDKNMKVVNGNCVWNRKCEMETGLCKSPGSYCVDLIGYRYKCECFRKNGVKQAINDAGVCDRACRFGRIRGEDGVCRGLKAFS